MSKDQSPAALLTEKEREDVYKYWLHSSTLTNEDGLIQLAEKAVLEKLAGMELPEPEFSREVKYSGIAMNKVVFEHYYTATQLRQAFAQGAASQLIVEPSGWIRKWVNDGESPAKERNENGRMAWPFKFKLLPITQHRVQKDDVPLYTLKAPK